GKRKKKGGNLFGLSPRQLRALLVVLQMAVAETEHQNATFTLIKAVVSQRIMLPEVYDLMTKLAELAVTSHRPTLRATAGQTFLTFVLQYPLGEKRLQFHLNQIVSGVSYEHAEGRLAALNLCSQLLRRLPEPNLDQLSSVFYLALVVRLVSDPAPECRAAASSAVNTLLARVSPPVFHELLAFTGQWFGVAVVTPTTKNTVDGGVGGERGGVGVGGGQGSDKALRRTAAQASGIFVQARPELVRKGTGAGKPLPWVLSALALMLPRRAVDVITAARSAGWGDSGGGGGGGGASQAVSVAGPGASVGEERGGAGGGSGADDWEGVYHAVLSIGKAFDVLPGACNAALVLSRGRDRIAGGGGGDASGELFDRLLEALLYPHAWVRLAAARVWGSFFSKRDPGTLAVAGGGGSGSDGSGGGSGSANKAGKADGKGRNQRGGARGAAGGEGRGAGEGGGAIPQEEARLVPPVPKLVLSAQQVTGAYLAIGVGGALSPFFSPRRSFPTIRYFLLIDQCAQVDPKLTEQCVKNLVFIGRAMHLNPHLCFAEEEEEAEEEGEGGGSGDEERGEEAGDGADGDDDDDGGNGDDGGGGVEGLGAQEGEEDVDPLRWVFNRMSHMVVHKGEARRKAVFSWFLAMVAVHEPAVALSHMKLMLLPLRRAVLDAESGGVEHKERSSTVAGGNAAGPEKDQTSAELATEVMELLEAKVGSGSFLEALTEVNMEISRKRVERKKQKAIEKATDPVAAAERRRERTEAGKV
ncbi:unnamed protein product, partial [Laminaria digitata]